MTVLTRPLNRGFSKFLSCRSSEVKCKNNSTVYMMVSFHVFICALSGFPAKAIGTIFFFSRTFPVNEVEGGVHNALCVNVL